MLYEKLFGNVMALNRYMRMQYIIPEIEKVSGQKILDIGCFDGHFTRYFSGRGNTVFAVDIRDNGIKQKVPDALFVVAKGATLPFKDNTFDYVFCSDVFEHIEDFEKIIPEIERVLKSGKECLVSTVEGYWSPSVKLRSVFLKKLPSKVSHAVMGRFSMPDEELHRNFLGHVRLDITDGKLEKSFGEKGLAVKRKKKYCHIVGSMLMEVFFSFNERIRYLIFPFLRMLLPLDKVFTIGRPWQFYIVFEKEA